MRLTRGPWIATAAPSAPAGGTRDDDHDARPGARRDDLTGACSEPRSARWSSRPCTSAIASGLYRSLADDGPATATGARRSGRHRPRDTPASGWSSRRWPASSMSTTSRPARRAALHACRPGTPMSCSTTDEHLAASAPIGRATSAAPRRSMPALLAAYPHRRRRRLGRPTAPTSSRRRRRSNRPQFRAFVGDWIAATCRTSPRGCADGDGRVADVACGTGWSSIAIARASRAPRRRHRHRRGLDRAGARQRRAAGAGPTGSRSSIADARGGRGRRGATTSSRSSRRSTTCPGRSRCWRRPGGCSHRAARCWSWTSATAERFTAPGDDMERCMYAYSVVCACPNGLDDEPSVGHRDGHATGRPRGDTPATRASRRSRSCPSSTSQFRFYRLDP